jgi:aspartate carbamoyltransferase catalytic subunit
MTGRRKSLSKSRHLLGARDVDPTEISDILSRSAVHRQNTPHRTLPRRVLITVCWPTRQREGADTGQITAEDESAIRYFEKAAGRLSMVNSSIIPHSSESLPDIFESIEAIVQQCAEDHLGIVVIRYPGVGVPLQISRLPRIRNEGASVINGGDG